MAHPRTLVHALAGLAACGGAGASTDDAATWADAAPDGPSGPRITWSGIIYDLDRDRPVTVDEQAPLAGVEVCAVVPGEPGSCVTSGSDGRFTLKFPPDTPGIALSAKKTGHASVLYVDATFDSDELEVVVYLPRAADVSGFMTSCGSSVPGPGDAALLIHGLERVTPAYVPLEGGTMTATGGVGPCYMEAPWLHGTSLTATTSNGHGAAVFGGVPVAGGKAQARVAKTDTTCTPARDAVPVLGDGNYELPVEPGFFTSITVICE
jgi:hypothetical protein